MSSKKDKEIEIEMINTNENNSPNMKNSTPSKTSKNKTSKNKTSKNKTSKSTKTLIAFIGIAIIFICCGIIFLVSNKAGKPVQSKDTQPATTEKVVIKDFVGIKQAKYISTLEEYYTYGTSLCIRGSISAEDLTDTDINTIDKISLVLKRAYTNEDGSTVEEDIEEFSLYTQFNENKISYSSYEKINEGINLENFEDNEYCMLLKLKYNDGNTKYCTLDYDGKMEPLCYYTITKNGINQKIDLSLEKFEDRPYIAFNVAESELPKDVYDIVLDPGHGGNDPGAVNGNYNEAVLMLDYAMDIKAALENEGYKVALTRDGTEYPNEKTAYTMYDENGRVNVACSTNAKICLSLHLNSNEVQLSRGGIQMYYTCRGSESFAKNIVENIVEASGTYVSPMLAFKVSDGVYTRAFSQSDIDGSIQDAINDGYEPYDMTTDTDYYYMIRELGGKATNAYVDGRNTRYGSNNYRDSRNGVESCIIEFGFISVDEDLNHIINNKDKYIEGLVNGINKWVKNT